MAKTKEELNQLKQEYETLNNKLKELTEEEINEVTGGAIGDWQNIEHNNNLDIKNPGEYQIYYGETTNELPNVSQGHQERKS